MVVLAVALLAAAVTLTPLTTNDLWVHLSVGRETVRDVLAGKGIPTEERFSFTAEGRPLVPHEWLSAVFFYGAARLAGVGSGATAWMLVLLLSSTAPRLIERPHLFSYVLAAWFLATLTADAQRAASGGSRAVWWLWPGLVVWGNLHGAFPLGFFLVACFLGAALVSLLPLPPRLRAALRLLPPITESAQRGAVPAAPDGVRSGVRRALRLGAVALGGAASLAILNPVGPRLLLFPFQLSSMQVATEAIFEWRSPFSTGAWKMYPFLLALAWAALLLAGACLVRLRRRPPVAGGWGLAGGVIALATAALAARQFRSYADFVLLTAPWLAAAVETLAWLARRRRGTAAGPAVPAAVALLAALFVARLGYPIQRHVWIPCIPPLVSPSTPVGAADFLAQIFDRPGKARVLNAYSLGGYLTWRLADHVTIYIDSRNEAYGEELTRRALAAMNDVDVFQQEATRWRPHMVVVDWRRRLASPVLRRLDSGAGWKLVYLDDWTAIYAASRAPLPALEFVAPTRLDLSWIGADRAAAALEEARRLEQWQPDGIVASALAGHALLAAGRPADAIVALEGAIAKNPRAPGLWGTLAAARAAAGDRQGAAAAAAQAQTLAKQAGAAQGPS